MQGGWRGGAGEEAAYQGGINEFPSVESQLTSFDRKKQQKEWLGLDFFFSGAYCVGPVRWTGPQFWFSQLWLPTLNQDNVPRRPGVLGASLFLAESRALEVALGMGLLI